jgi:putative peptidoglycan lipid II flippase
LFFVEYRLMCLKKIFKPMGLGGASALIAFASFLSYAVGLLRDRTIAVHFGTTTATDTYNASFLIPDILFNLFIAGALVAAFMPIFSEYLEKNRKEAFALANTMISGASLLIAFLAVVAFIFMESIIPAMFPSVDPEGQMNIIYMTRLMLPSAFLFAISNTLGNILMTYRHFFSFAISPVLYNLGIILGIVFLNGKFGIHSAAIGVLIGASFHLLIRLVDIFYTGYKYKPQLKIKHPGFKKIIKLMIPKSISLIAWQLNLYIFAVVGMRMMEGGLAAFNFARNIQSFAVSLFGIAFATAVFPSLNSAISKGDKASFTKNIQTTLHRILFFTIPAMVGLMLLAESVTDLILGGGAFGEESIKLTSIILFFFALSIPLESLNHLFARSFYAMKNTMTPMLINIFSLTVVALITIFVAPVFGIEWFSIGFTVGFVLYNILFITLLKRHLQEFDFKKLFKSLTKTLISTAVMGVIVYISQDLEGIINVPEKAFHVSRIALGGITYLSTAYLLKSPEVHSIQFLLKRLIKR